MAEAEIGQTNLGTLELDQLLKGNSLDNFLWAKRPTLQAKVPAIPVIKSLNAVGNGRTLLTNSMHVY